VAKFDAAGAARWAVTTPVVDVQGHYEVVGFVGALGDGSLLSAWRPPALSTSVATWTLSEAGAERALGTVAAAPAGAASTFAIFTANARGELFSAVHIDSPLATHVAHWRADGSRTAQRDLAESTLAYPDSAQVSPQGALILTSIEPWTQQKGTALVVRVLTGF
jgi:hypothetical protein